MYDERRECEPGRQWSSTKLPHGCKTIACGRGCEALTHGRGEEDRSRHVARTRIDLFSGTAWLPR